jgi:hypothetical protein
MGTLVRAVPRGNPQLKRIESFAFSRSSLQSTTIPCNIEILGSSHLKDCQSLSSISFETDSRLKRIESDAFSFSSLQSIVIPRNVQFIDGSAFIGINLHAFSIETSHERSMIDKEFLVDIIDYRLIRSFSSSSHVEIYGDIEMLGSSCFCMPNAFINFL